MKIAGILVVISISTLSGIMLSEYKKRQIDYTVKLIYIGERILFMLENTLPDTDEMFNRLKADKRLEGFDFSFSDKSIPVDEELKSSAVSFINSIGKYDEAVQIKLCNEYISNMRLIKEEYQKSYTSHHKLYIAFGMLSGVLFTVLII